MKDALRLLTACTLLFVAPAARSDWAKDLITKCEVLLPVPRANSTVIWKGACADGRASGKGAVTTYGLRLEGEFHEGKPSDATGFLIEIESDGTNVPKRISYVDGKYSVAQFSEMPDSARIPINPLIGNWQVQRTDSQCPDFDEYQQNHRATSRSGASDMFHVVQLFSVASMPEWMLLERTSISKNHLPDCRGNTPKALFETAKIYLRLDHDGKLSYCTQPILNTCFAVATRAASDAWKRQRAESSVISSNAESGSYNPANIARSFGGPNTPPGTPIVVTFDRNKGALYALYGRALRTNPQLKGTVVFELMISVTGEVTSCRLISSELHDAVLERKLVARVGLIRFGPQDAPVTVAMPVDFNPADS